MLRALWYATCNAEALLPHTFRPTRLDLNAPSPSPPFPRPDGLSSLLLEGDSIEPGGLRAYKRLFVACRDPQEAARLQRLIAEGVAVSPMQPDNEVAPFAWAVDRLRQVPPRHGSTTFYKDWRRGSAVRRRRSSTSSFRSPNENQEEEDDDAFQSFVTHQRLQTSSEAAMQSWKEKWVNDQLQLREAEFTDYEPCQICIGTFNVNGRRAQDGSDPIDLAPWLQPEDAEGECPDIYVLGFQELDLSKEAFVFNDSKREEEWSLAIEAALPLRGNYAKIVSRQLVGMLIVVYAREGWSRKISRHDTDAQGTGIMGVMGNKGGVAVSFTLLDTEFCFVNSHLAAHDDNVARRNQDHKDIYSGINFERSRGKVRLIFDHDYIFWLGDLNYRLNAGDIEVKAMVANKDTEGLLQFDQLKQQQRIGAAFDNFHEPTITFLPTYKYDIGTDNFDTSEKMRCPAYCDRILFYQDEESSMQLSVGGGRKGWETGRRRGIGK